MVFSLWLWKRPLVASGTGLAYPLVCLVLVLSSVHIKGQVCPLGRNKQVVEHTPIGTSLFNITTVGVDSLKLFPSRPLYKGYLKLQQKASQSFEIVINGDLDLNVLNPRDPPVPNTNEDLPCNYTGRSSSSGSPIKTVEYELECQVTINGHVVKPRSKVIIAIEDVNDKVPYFMCAPYHKTINELTPLYTTVFTLGGLAADPDIDGGIHGYQLSGGEGKFGISGAASNGFIVLQGELDYEVGPHTYMLNVTVTDVGEPPLSNWTLLYITVGDGDDENPVFSRETYYITLPEQNSSILHQSFTTSPPVYAYDPDLGINATVGYALESGHVLGGLQYFNISKDTGQLIPLRLLDRNSVSQFIMRVKTYQLDNPKKRFNYASIVVTVADVNVNKPEMQLLYYNATIPENSPRGYKVLQVSALDRDQGVNAMFKYILKDGTGAFQIDPRSGVISVRDPLKLDREAQNTFTFTVFAEETQTSQQFRSDQASIVVTLSDANDNSPVFLSSHFNFLVNKTVPVGTLVGQVAASDKDIGRNKELRYKIQFGTNRAESRFRIDAATGQIFTAASLETPLYLGYMLTVQARDQPEIPSHSRSTAVQVNITVLDQNVHAPIFIGGPYSASVSEASTVGTTILDLKVVDKDPTSEVTILIVAGDPKSQFGVKQETQSLVTRAPLDREDTPQYTLTLAAGDGIQSTKTVVYVTVTDVNDKDAVFEKPAYLFGVMEEQKAGALVGLVQAYDNDTGVNAELEYSIVSNWAKQFLAINPTSGKISTVQTLDREKISTYEFIIVAQDKGQSRRSGTASVTVTLLDVNDQAPVWVNAPYTVSVPERSVVQPFLSVQATDKDVGVNGIVKYDIIRGNTAIFGIDTANGQIYPKMELNLEGTTRQSQYVLQVLAYNIVPYASSQFNLTNATTTVTVNVVDVNDNTPVFTMDNYQFYVLENLTVGSEVGRVLAQDVDSAVKHNTVHYWLSGGNSGKKFRLEENTGILRLWEAVDRDSPTSQVGYVLKVTASDMVLNHFTRKMINVTATIHVTIQDINDSPPKFSKSLYRVQVPENAAVNSTVTTSIQARDLDEGRNSLFTYDIQVPSLPFIIDGSTGALRVGTSLNYDQGVQYYKFPVLAIDQGQPALTGTASVEVMLVNVNNHAPQYQQHQYRFSVAENLAAGTLVGHVTAIDRDHDVIQYSLNLGHAAMFKVNNATGEIRTTQSLDHEAESSLKFSVVARDVLNAKGRVNSVVHSTPVTVIVDVLDRNDNSPKFVHAQYRTTVRENSTKTVITQVVAHDADSGANGQVHYGFVSGNEDGFFFINATSGNLWVVQGTGLNYGRRPMYTLVVEAVDGGSPPRRNTTSVLVTVVDINDHTPKFTKKQYAFTVKEDVPPWTVFGKVTATDLDSGDTVFYGLNPPHSNFTINTKSGALMTKTFLDREVSGFYQLQASAFDRKFTTLVTVNVTVEDVNDNPPVFEKTSYQKYIGQDTQIGRVILKVAAKDRDAGHNGYLTYWVTGTDGKFEIDPDSGYVKIAGKFDRTLKDNFALRVFARDHGYPPLMSNVSLTIFINDTNRHKPQFLQFALDATVPEDAAINTTVMVVNVTDYDSGPAGQVDLAITKGNVGHAFAVYPTGQIKINKHLDFERVKFYELGISATDRGDDPFTTRTVVRVRVTDANDKQPAFVPIPPVIFTPGPTSINDLVFQFYATDDDSSLNGNNKVQYSIETHFSPFSIDGQTGILHTRRALGIGSYGVTVRATDMGNPQLKTDLTVTIQIVDSAGTNTYPSFEPKWYTVSTNESHTPPLFIVDLNARIGSQDFDVGVKYNISSGAHKSLYTINTNTGVIETNQMLNREQAKEHFLLVTAENKARPGFSTQTGVFIRIKDSNNRAPYFPFHKYHATVREDIPVAQTVITLFALDPDIKPKLTYSIVSDDSKGHFRLVSFNNTAVVSVGRSLDRDTMPGNMSGIYTMRIGVHDGVNHGTPSTLLIQVEDINDNPPYFSQAHYHAQIPESAGPCLEVIQVQAKDVDTVDEGQLTYSIVAGNDDQFEVTNTTGMISVSCSRKQALDREAVSQYSLTVFAMDSKNNKAMTRVTVQVLDVNDNAPRFLAEPYTARIREGATSLQLEIKVGTLDRDQGNNSQVVFSLGAGNEDGEFTIESITGNTTAVGKIRVVKPLDREKAGLTRVNGTGVYHLTVLAKDSGIPQRTATSTVSIYVLDINDNQPVFERAQYRISISEGTPVGTTVITVSATDPDLPKNNNITYSIDELGNKGTFVIDEHSGSVKVAKPLDLTVQGSYNITLRAYDGRFTSLAKLSVQLVDINDNDPQFTLPVYHFNVSENDATGRTGQLVGQVMAIDRDNGINGEVLYSVTSRNARGRFNITRPETGKIYVVGTLDREKVDSYTLIVTAKDRGTPHRMSTCEVEVSVMDYNDNPPRFVDAPYTGVVDEHAKPGTTVFVFPAVKAVDADIGYNAEIVYGLGGLHSNLFIIDPVRGVVTVAAGSGRQLDRETMQNVKLQIIAMDRNGTRGSLKSTTSLNIKLRDINDNGPAFLLSTYTFNISEAAVAKSRVGQVQAADRDADPNNRLQYTILSGSDGKFYMDRLSGEIFVTGGLDREIKESYHLNISALDSGITPGPLEGIAVVVIKLTDFNDNAPKFIKRDWMFRVSENKASGVFVGTVSATDNDVGDNGRITYYLNGSEPFEVDAANGHLITRDRLDREAMPVYNFYVYAKDYGTPELTSSTRVTVIVKDENDHSPMFDQPVYRVNILEKSPVYSVLVFPHATDKDQGANANLTYSLHGMNGSEIYFHINGLTGLIQIARAIDKSRLIWQGLLGPNHLTSDNSTLALTIRAVDSGQPQRAGEALLFVHIDEINDDTPLFENISYDVDLPEEVAKGTSVVKVKAATRDTDTQISYTVTDSTYFVMADSTSGVIRTTGRRLDREEQEFHSFTVRAVDNRIPQRTAYTVVSVRLQDVNDHTPTFGQNTYRFSIEEGIYSNKILGKVDATDPDTGLNGRIFYSILQEGSPFLLDNRTGQLRLTGELDRETTAGYSLTVMAEDKGRPPNNSTSEVIIQVIDVNDNSPVFHGQPYWAVVPENVAAGHKVAQLYANDTDDGRHGIVYYKLVEPSGGEKLPFYIQNTGAVYTLSSLDYERTYFYNLTVLAVDMSDVPRTGSAQLFINVTDIPDDQPHFLSRLYELKVPENMEVGSPFVTIGAGTGAYHYNITAGNLDGTFAVNHTNGALMLNKKLDFRVTQKYEITLTATDFKNPSSTDSTKVRVIVESRSPVPIFPKREYKVTYEENRLPPNLVIDLNTTDELAGHQVNYTIVSGNVGGVFHLESSSTGKIFCVKKLDRESVSGYSLVVRADKVAGVAKATRQKRAVPQSGMPNEAVVTISVGDVNDNNPKFLINPLIVGVPYTAGFNYLVTILKPFDPDEGNNSAQLFTVVGGADKAAFYVDPFLGLLKSQINFAKTGKTTFYIDVKATDNLGQGQSDTVKVQVHVLSPAHQVILVAKIPPKEFILRQEELTRNLSDILGWRVVVEKVEPHVEPGSKRVDITVTDMYFYAVDDKRQKIVMRDRITEKLKEKAKEIEALFAQFKVQEVRPVTVVAIPIGISVSQGALIALSVFIFFGTLFGIIVVLYSWRQREVEQINSIQKYMHMNGRPQSGLQLTNPLFMEAEYEYAEPAEGDGDGNRIIVVDNNAPTTNGGPGDNSWALPYEGDVPVNKRLRRQKMTRVEPLGVEVNGPRATSISGKGDFVRKENQDPQVCDFVSTKDARYTSSLIKGDALFYHQYGTSIEPVSSFTSAYLTGNYKKPSQTLNSRVKPGKWRTGRRATVHEVNIGDRLTLDVSSDEGVGSLETDLSDNNGHCPTPGKQRACPGSAPGSRTLGSASTSGSGSSGSQRVTRSQDYPYSKTVVKLPLGGAAMLGSDEDSDPIYATLIPVSRPPAHVTSSQCGMLEPRNEYSIHKHNQHMPKLMPDQLYEMADTHL